MATENNIPNFKYNILNQAWAALQSIEKTIKAFEYIGVNIDGSSDENNKNKANSIYDASTKLYDIITSCFGIKSGTSKHDDATNAISEYLDAYSDPVAFPENLYYALSEISGTTEKLNEYWVVFESNRDQTYLKSADSAKFYDYDCMETFTNEFDAINYQLQNPENRMRKLIKIKN